MAQATLTKVGNSAAAFIPKATRDQAGVEVGQEYDISSPRPGVVVLTFHKNNKARRLERLLEAERAIRAQHLPAWNRDTDANTLIEQGKARRVDAILLP